MRDRLSQRELEYLYAALDVDQDEALRLRQSGEVLSFQAILRQADERYPGARLLEAELDEHRMRFDELAWQLSEARASAAAWS